jgi:carboxypeptidase D
VYTVHFAGDADYICNWLGVEAIVDDINPAGYADAGFVNITTSDALVHGQVKQSDNAAFVRIYESGHEVPFYQPLVALEMFERVIKGQDVATGKKRVEKGGGYKTVGTAKSEYREGNGTVQWDVVPDGAIYNTTTHVPEVEAGVGSGNETVVEKRGLGKKSTRVLSRRADARQPMAAPVRIPRL